MINVDDQSIVCGADSGGAQPSPSPARLLLDVTLAPYRKPDEKTCLDLWCALFDLLLSDDLTMRLGFLRQHSFSLATIFVVHTFPMIFGCGWIWDKVFG